MHDALHMRGQSGGAGCTALGHAEAASTAHNWAEQALWCVGLGAGYPRSQPCKPWLSHTCMCGSGDSGSSYACGARVGFGAKGCGTHRHARGATSAHVLGGRPFWCVDGGASTTN